MRGSGIRPSKCATSRSSTCRFSSGERISGTPERCAETKFHVGTLCDVAVPAGRDVAVRTLHDDHQLALPQPVDHVVGLADVAHDREVVALLVEQHGVVRRDEPVGGAADGVIHGFRSMRRRSSATSVIAKLGFWRMHPAYERAQRLALSGTSRACAWPSPRPRSPCRTPGTAGPRGGRPSAGRRGWPSPRGTPPGSRSSIVIIWPVSTPIASSRTQSRQSSRTTSSRHVAARRVRVLTRAEQQLGAVDVADAADDGLVHQQQADRGRLAAHDRGEALLALGDVVDERVGSELRDRRGDLVGRLQLARGRPAQVGARDVRQQAQPHLADDGRRPLVALVGEARRLLRHAHVHARAPRGADRGQRVLAGGIQDRRRRASRARAGSSGPCARSRTRSSGRPRSRRRSPTPRTCPDARAARGRRRTRGTSACRRRAPRSRSRPLRMRAPSANRPCGLDAATARPTKLRSNWRAIRWTECPSGISRLRGRTSCRRRRARRAARRSRADRARGRRRLRTRRSARSGARGAPRRRTASR